MVQRRKEPSSQTKKAMREGRFGVVLRAEKDENALFLHFFAKKFAYMKKKQYFCTRF